MMIFPPSSSLESIVSVNHVHCCSRTSALFASSADFIKSSIIISVAPNPVDVPFGDVAK